MGPVSSVSKPTTSVQSEKWSTNRTNQTVHNPKPYGSYLESYNIVNFAPHCKIATNMWGCVHIEHKVFSHFPFTCMKVRHKVSNQEKTEEKAIEYEHTWVITSGRIDCWSTQRAPFFPWPEQQTWRLAQMKKIKTKIWGFNKAGWR